MKAIDPMMKEHMERMHQQMRKHLQELAGGRDLRGIELGNALRGLSNCYENAVAQSGEFTDLSGPRLGILVRLQAEEDLDNHAGINPSQLSHFQRVNRNTISALISGLEEQGLVERAIDPQDKRGFLIRITPTGRVLLNSSAPRRIEFMTQLSSGLTSEELDQLLSLLEKLHLSIRSNRQNDI